MQQQRQVYTFKLLEPTMTTKKTVTTSSSSSSSSTDKVILDYLLYISIQTQLDQADRELEKQHNMLNNIISIQRTDQQDKKSIIDSTVTGILSSYQKNNNDYFLNKYHHNNNCTNAPFQQRLNLYLLSNHVLNRYDAMTNDHVMLKRKRGTYQNNKLFTTPLSSCCRRHQQLACESCPTRTNKKKSGLMDAIPMFLKTSADLLRRALDNKDMVVFAGQQVMGGGMPPTWYDLFLNLLTQAAIECYLCDGQLGPEPIFEIFSYGYVEDEDEPDELDEDELDEDDPASSLSSSEDSDDDDDEDEDEGWNVKAADHHLLFPKTRTMYLFKTQVREREKEFLQLNKETDLQDHFDKLAQRYPLLEFEKSMHEFIQMVFKSMDVPALDKYGEADVASMVYRYPSDGSLLMPEVPDDEASIYVVPDQSSPHSSSASSSSSLSTTSSLVEEEAAALTAIASCSSPIQLGIKRSHHYLHEPTESSPSPRKKRFMS